MASPSDGMVDRAVRTTSPYGKTGETTMRVQTWTEEQRTSRAIKRLAICWGFALVAAIIPPHIPWLTIMVLSGPIVAWLAWRTKGTIQENQVPCPDCGAKVAVEEQPENWPIAARCKECRNIFSIDRA